MHPNYPHEVDHPNKTLVGLYDPDLMPEDLSSAHNALDSAVEEAYGVNFDGDEEKIVGHLFSLYEDLTNPYSLIPNFGLYEGLTHK